MGEARTISGMLHFGNHTMKILGIAGWICALAMLGGCAVYTPSGSVVIDPVGTHVPSSRGGFCPPGQAKKGNC